MVVVGGFLLSCSDLGLSSKAWGCGVQHVQKNDGEWPRSVDPKPSTLEFLR